MRHRRSQLNGIILISCLYCLAPLTTCIMVPTGKLTPIEPAEPSAAPSPVPSSARRAPAPVNEYTVEHPEPPPLDPSYVPPQFNYIQYLSPHAIVYVPMQLKLNYAAAQKLDKFKTKYDKYGKLPQNVLQKYEDYPAHLQKKYIHYYLTQSNKS